MAEPFLACRYATHDRPGRWRGLEPLGSWQENHLEVAWGSGVDVWLDADAFCAVKGWSDSSAAEIASAVLLQGSAALEPLRGDFVLLVWDRTRRSGLLARDHVGAEAVFWSVRGVGMVAADEMEPLLDLLPTRPEPDRLAILQWSEQLPLTDQRTMFAGVKRLAPAHALRFGPRQLVSERYWRPRFRPGSDLTPVQLRHDLGRAVGQRLDPGRPAALLLSGGLDSGTVAALATEHRAGSILGVTATFPNHPEMDEGRLVRRLAADLGCKTLIRPVSDGGIVRAAVEHQQRWRVPSVGWADVYEQPLLRAAAERGARVLIHGEGGDELFFPRIYAVGDRLRRGQARHAAQWMWLFLGGRGRAFSPEVLRAVLRFGVLGSAPYGVLRAGQRLRSQLAPRSPWLTRADALLLAEHAQSLSFRRWPEPAGWAATAHALCAVPDALGITDHLRRRAVWAGLAPRHPLYNADVIETCLQLSDEQTFGPVILRRPLREAVDDILIRDICWRREKAFFDRWVVDSLRLDLPVMVARLTQPNALINTYLSREGIRQAVQQPWERHSVGPLSAAVRLLRLFLTEMWLAEQGSDDMTAIAARLSPGRIGSPT